MDASKTLKDAHPQKYYMKKLCRAIYYMGLGDCWYEKSERSRIHKVLYAIWAITINGYIILNTLNEVLANFRTDLTVKEKNDLLQFTFAHSCLTAKYVCLVLQKKRIRALLERLLEGSRSVYVSPDVDRKSVGKALFYAKLLIVATFFTIFSAFADGVRTYIKEGVPIRTEVVFYPTRSHSGLLINIIRIIVELHWWCIVSNMLLVHFISLFSMVYVRHKFTMVNMYFKNLRNNIKKNIKRRVDVAKEFEKEFVVGIKFHEDTLWCAKNVQYALGNVYSAQVFESIALLVMCLVKLATLDRNLTFIIANIEYIMGLLLVTSVYFAAAGDVTYEACEVSTSIFECGWELVPLNRLRPLLVVAVQRSQVPVVMTAFGVLILSHHNFISVPCTLHFLVTGCGGTIQV